MYVDDMIIMMITITSQAGNSVERCHPLLSPPGPLSLSVSPGTKDKVMNDDKRIRQRYWWSPFPDRHSRCQWSFRSSHPAQGTWWWEIDQKRPKMESSQIKGREKIIRRDQRCNWQNNPKKWLDPKLWNNEKPKKTQISPQPVLDGAAGAPWEHCQGAPPILKFTSRSFLFYR